MIEFGFLEPTADQLKQIRAKADGSFCVVSDQQFLSNFPTVPNYTHSDAGALLLRLKNVEPHVDPWVAPSPPPKIRKSIFWLLSGGKTCGRKGIIFGVADQTIRLFPHQFVIFDDSLQHWVMSDTTWYGATTQLIEV